MIIWLASYPRSGNTFFRILLHQMFGLPTDEAYRVPSSGSLAEDVAAMMGLMGQKDFESDIDALRADSAVHFLKTHDLPNKDGSPAVVLIRDGRDSAVSYAHFVLKTERGIECPGRDVFDAALEEIITADRFGGWSRNVTAWIDRVGWDNVVRYEDLIQDPVNVVATALHKLGVDIEREAKEPPSFQELKKVVPWFFRSGKRGSWIEEMPPYLHDLFLERHGEALRRLGYSQHTPQMGKAERSIQGTQPIRSTSREL